MTTIEVDINSLIENDLSPDEFVYLSMLNHNDIDATVRLKVDFEELQTKGWIKIGEGDEVTLREKFNNTFVGSFDQMWHELLSHYPLKVITNGTVRILRAKDSESKANSKAKTKYQKIIGKNVAKHKEIISLLQRELDFRRRGNNLAYMQMLETWLNNYTWEKYKDTNDGESKSESIEPGRISRQL
jgi:hypothetical protein